VVERGATTRDRRVRRPTRLATVCLAVVVLFGGPAAALSSIDGVADRPTVAAVRVDPPKPAVVVGDSAIAALRWVPNAASAVVGFPHTLDLESCRRLFAPSCRGREGRVPPTVYEALSVHGGSYHTLVVATGYNDASLDFAGAFDRVVRRARSYGYERIVWYTLRSDVDYVSPGALGNHVAFAAANATLRQLVATGTYPEVVLADWGGYTADRPGWFATDGVHYRNVGAWAAADYLSRKMAFLDGRACPIPVSTSAQVQDPCPDPDRTGPVADIEALYPIGEDGVLCYEVGSDRRFECRYDTHVLQLTRILSIGATGRDVSAVQIRLQRLGYVVPGIDGVFGQLTADAVRGFQADHGLPRSGTADVATLDALGFDTSAVG
jgi:hypothetical protein